MNGGGPADDEQRTASLVNLEGDRIDEAIRDARICDALDLDRSISLLADEVPDEVERISLPLFVGGQVAGVICFGLVRRSIRVA
jgi:hypothetical protein